MAVARNAVIVGGGIGGLSTGLALKRAGWSVQVLERSPELQPIGAGLSLWPNAVRALRALGAGEIVDSGGALEAGVSLRRADGSPIYGYEARAIEDRYGAPLVGVHRADLLEGLLRALGEDSVRFGAGASRAGDGIVLLSDGGEIEGDLIVGADGLHSVVREHLLGSADPRESGIASFRGVVAWSGDVRAGEWWGPGSIAGMLPVGEGRVYWYVGYRGDSAGGAAELAARAEDYGSPIPELIAATPEEDVLFHNLFDRDPPTRMAAGNVALVGDAAHPMLPFLGQGACCALEDAVALALAVEAGVDIESALAGYDADRVPRAKGLVKGSRAAARIALAPGALARTLRNATLGVAPSAIRIRQLDRVIEG